MGDGEKNKKPAEYSDERFKYIGFDVFPGRAGDMFESDEERKNLIEKVKGKLERSQGEVRDRCTLIESRLSGVEKGFLTLAAVAMVLALFLPWFSGYIPVSYEEMGSYGDYSFYYASESDQGSIADVSDALRQKHEKKFARSLTMEEKEKEEEGDSEEPAMMGDVPMEGEGAVDSMVAEGSGEEVAETEEAPVVEEETGGEETAEPTEEEEKTAAKDVPAEIKVFFVDYPQLDDIHGMNDIREHVVGYYSFNARTGAEVMEYGTGEAIDRMPAELLERARVNDSIAVAVTDSMKQAVAERVAEGDSTVSPDSVFYAGPVLIEDKAISELAMKGIVNDHYSMTGIGAIMSLGEYAPMVFSGGPVLMITGVLLIVYFVCCIILAALNLYLIYGVKKKSIDDYYLYLKRMLRYNWIPVGLWLIMFIISFFGADYGFNTAGMIKQVGDSYSIATFIGLSSFGIYLTLAAFLITALKGKEI